MPAQFLLVFASDLQSAGRLSGAVAVDKDSFSDLMKLASPSAAVTIKCPLTEFDSRLTFDSNRAFEPE